jgi:hypothetical protein
MSAAGPKAIPKKFGALTQRVQALSAILDQAAQRDPVIAAALGVPAFAGPAAAADREAG